MPEDHFWLTFLKTMALLEYRMGQVEKKLDSHNGYAKLFSETASQIAAIQTDIAVIKTTLSFVGKDGGHDGN